MRKMIIISCLLILFLTGCSGQADAIKVSADGYALPRLKQIGECNGSGYSYLVDERTGVVYIEYRAPQLYGITVAYNEDGKVMMEKDIKIGD